MTERDKSIILAMRENGESYSAIANALRIPVGTVKALCSREKKTDTNLQDFMSVRIDDQIYIKYTLHNRDGLESVTVTYYDQDGVEVQQEKSKAANELTFDENGMFVILAEVAPAQIGDMITVTINANGDSTEYETSIKNYCNHLIANYDGVDAADVKALAKATLEYGQAAND